MNIFEKLVIYNISKELLKKQQETLTNQINNVKDNKPIQYNFKTESKIFKLIAFGFLILFIITLMIPSGGDKLGKLIVTISLLILIIISILLYKAYNKWELLINKDNIQKTNFLGKTTTYDYSEITDVKIDVDGNLEVYTGKDTNKKRIIAIAKTNDIELLKLLISKKSNIQETKEDTTFIVKKNKLNRLAILICEICWIIFIIVFSILQVPEGIIIFILISIIQLPFTISAYYNKLIFSEKEIVQQKLLRKQIKISVDDISRIERQQYDNSDKSIFIYTTSSKKPTFKISEYTTNFHLVEKVVFGRKRRK